MSTMAVNLDKLLPVPSSGGAAMPDPKLGSPTRAPANKTRSIGPLAIG